MLLLCFIVEVFVFTGIIQEQGFVATIEQIGDARRFEVRCKGYFSGLGVGASVAHNGVCLTLERHTDDCGWVTAIAETLQKTNLGQLKVGNKVNLELPCTADSFLGGHLVQGHVDSMSEVLEVVNRETGCEFWLKLDESVARFFVYKGSVTLDGVSLTVAELEKDRFKVAIIPETLHKTNLSDWQPRTKVNVEVDVIGRYVERLLKPHMPA
jgi:riboflavin synthase